MKINKGDYSVIKDVVKDKTQAMPDFPKFGEEKPGLSTTTDVTSADRPEVKQKEVPSDVETKIKRRKTDWKSIVSKAIGGSGLSAEKKKLIQNQVEKKPLVDWKGKLRKFFDKSLTGIKTVFPKRRMIGSDTYMYGSKRSGVETLKVIVAAIDTSGSISKEQGKTFLVEVAHLVEQFKADKFYIIYCSDDIDQAIELKKGQHPDYSVWPSTGGNSKGFLPPFEWVKKNNIKPSVFVYLTDTGGEMPSKKDFGIAKYAEKVFWFICTPVLYNKPEFGEIIYMPLIQLKETK